MISIPFIGSKKYSYKQVRKIVEDRGYKDVYEPFGGSCVLSVNLLNDGLVEAAYVNDYDHFFDDYPEYMDLKDKVVRLGYAAGLKRTSHDSKNGKYMYDDEGKRHPVDTVRLYGEQREIIQNIIKENVPERLWRHFTLGTNFTHSGVSHHKKIHLSDFAMFNAYLKTDKQRAYYAKLQECEISNCDFRAFLDKYRDQITPDSLIIADPPYVETTQCQYAGQFGYIETDELIRILNTLPCDYIFFNRDPDLMEEWLAGTDHEIVRTGTVTKGNTAHSKVEYLAYIRKTGPIKGLF